MTLGAGFIQEAVTLRQCQLWSLEQGFTQLIQLVSLVEGIGPMLSLQAVVLVEIWPDLLDGALVPTGMNS